jgi:hypothetical protein
MSNAVSRPANDSAMISTRLWEHRASPRGPGGLSAMLWECTDTMPETGVDVRRRTIGSEETNLPKLAAPARRALQGAGFTRLEDLTKVTESEVMKLHGMGANAMQVLRNALGERGLSFRDG